MPSIVRLIAPLAVFALGAAPQVDAQELPPTPIEAALVARACQAIETPSTDIDAHLQCVSAQLFTLRASFGRDLSRLSRSDRTKIDTVCSPLGTGERRNAYLDCVADQLVAVRNRLARGNPTVPENGAVAPSPLLDPSASAMPPTDQATSWPSAIVMGGIVGIIVLLAAAGAVFLARKSRRPRRACRVCGLDSADSDLCPACRHEAAEALRHAALERALTQKAQEEDERHREEEAEKQRAREKEEKEEEEAKAHLMEQELRRQEEEDAHRQNEPAVGPVAHAAEEVFDPYVVLGAPHDTNQDGIRTAYQQAITKYDPALVSHLSEEVQAHFRAKAESIERAYQMLSNAHP